MAGGQWRWPVGGGRWPVDKFPRPDLYVTRTLTLTLTQSPIKFPRPDLYVWELLQNAVDDGASNVLIEKIHTSSGNGVRVRHDGRRFSPLDVLGLCRLVQIKNGEPVNVQN